jgi:peptidoglycan/LPS O-acetylase OafA/YrhL
VKGRNTQYLVGLDHVRAFAALLIVFYHGLHVFSFYPRADGGDPLRFWIISRNPFVVLLEEGHSAVALFIVMSGFILSVGALGREISYWPYLQNRILRIYPLFVVLLFVGLAAHPGQYSLLGLIQTLLFQANYQGVLVLAPFSSMFWAVAVELQLYLLFPLLHRFIERHGARWVLGAVMLCLVLRLLATTGSSNARDLSYWQVLGRLDQFLIGMLTARVFRRVQHLQLPWGWLSLLAFSFTLSVLFAFNHQGGFPPIPLWKIAWPTIEALAWAPLLLTYSLFAQRVPRLLSAPLAAIGTVSYSIYLLHYTLITTLPRWFNFQLATDPNVASQLYTALVVVPALLPLAALSYYVVERPFLNMRVSYLSPRAARAPAADNATEPQA